MIGKSILHYKILEKLGEGGMGVVYKAEDTKLKREVAIKFLPRQIAASEEERSRFKIEAQAAAALNHPNIATIYAIEEVDDEMFIVMEYIEGRELREIIAASFTKPLRFSKVTDYATQIAAGLQAAHKKGVTHRDIKSANIMVTESGQVKIMDFGLAKMRGSVQLTKAGTTLGTAAYMSPEQARGEDTDHRTDIWAFGVVLYEMLAGELPFKGDYEQAVMYAILNEEPETLAETRPETAGHFQSIIEKILAKDRDERYQSMSDVLTDLRQAAPEVGHESASSGKTDDRSNTPPLDRRQKTLIIGLGIVAGLVLIAIALWKGIFVGQKNARPFQNMQITRLTNTGRAGFANISPDGNYGVHVLHDRNQSSLWVRQVATGSNVQIVPPADVAFEGTTFSRDGNYIFYVMSDKVSLVSTLYRIPTLGGAPKKILSNISSNVTLSPDGRQIAFVRQFSSQGEEALMLANVDGSAVRKLASRKEPEFFVDDDRVGPSWSPDGKLIACGAGSVAGEWRMGVLLVSVENGTQEWLLQPKRRFRTNRVVWTPDGKGLVVNAVDTTSQSRYQLWHVAYPEAELHRVTNDLNSYEPTSLGLAADGRTLVTVKVERTSNIWTIPDLDASRAVQLSFTAGTDEGTAGVSFTADGRIVYSSVESGNPDVWIMDQDGGNKRRLTTDPAPDRWPSVTRDGRSLVFHSDRASIPHIWKMDLESGELVQLTEREDYDPACTWDGKWVVYWGYRPGQPGLSSAAYTVRKVAIDGGPPVQLTDKIARRPAASPDGKYVACQYQDAPGGPVLLAILPFDGGQPLELFEIPPSVERFVWTADGHAVMYVDTQTGVSNIWSQLIAGGPPKKLTHFKSGVIFNFATSRDGRTLVCARGSVSSDVVLIKDFR